MRFKAWTCSEKGLYFAYCICSFTPWKSASPQKTWPSQHPGFPSSKKHRLGYCCHCCLPFMHCPTYSVFSSYPVVYTALLLRFAFSLICDFYFFSELWLTVHQVTSRTAQVAPNAQLSCPVLEPNTHAHLTLMRHCFGRSSIRQHFLFDY